MEKFGLANGCLTQTLPSNLSATMYTRHLWKKKSKLPSSLFCLILNFYRKLVHPNVVTLFGLWKEGKEVLLVMEYMKLGSLDSFLPSNPKLDQLELIWMCVQIARGMEYLGTLSITHNDLASRNILLKPDNAHNVGSYLLKIAGNKPQE